MNPIYPRTSVFLEFAVGAIRMIGQNDEAENTERRKYMIGHRFFIQADV